MLHAYHERLNFTVEIQVKESINLYDDFINWEESSFDELVPEEHLVWKIP